MIVPYVILSQLSNDAYISPDASLHTWLHCNIQICLLRYLASLKPDAPSGSHYRRIKAIYHAVHSTSADRMMYICPSIQVEGLRIYRPQTHLNFRRLENQEKVKMVQIS